jgi:hypothetical protein
MRQKDFSSETWNRLTKTLQARLQELRELNDQTTLSPEKTMLIRGQISMIKEILALPQGSASPVEDPSDSVFVTPVPWQNMTEAT